MSAGRTAARAQPALLMAWLARLFGGRRPAGADAEPATAAGAATAAAVTRAAAGAATAAGVTAAGATAAGVTAAATAATRGAGGAGAAGSRAEAPSLERDGMIGHARFIGFEVSLAGALPEEEEAAVERLVGQVLAHADAHPPDPDAAPSLASRILERASDPEVDLPQLTRLVSQDPAVAAEVLNVANSAALRGLEEAKNVREAITRIGLREAAQIAAALAVRTLFDGDLRASPPSLRSRRTAQFKEAMVVAMGSAALAMQLNRGRSDYAFLGGMFHDIGGSLALRALAALLQDGRSRPSPPSR